MKTFMIATLVTSLVAPPAFASGIEAVLAALASDGVASFDPEAGHAFFTRDFNGKRCTGCHGDDLTRPGRHVRTGKEIAPMAPSVNKERLTDSARINKWLLRNCKWTLGRECTAQEKGDVLIWLGQQ